MDAMSALALQDDVLTFLFWASQEGIFSRATLNDLKTYLNEDGEQIRLVLRHLQEGGLIRADDGGQLSLTEVGQRMAAESFREEFHDFTGRSHGECSDDCACHQNGWENCSGR